MSEFAFDVSIEDFETKVLQPAETVPVVVDFWAPWCEPCKVLKPLLEKLAEEYKGRFLLAMVNADEYPEIAQQFGVRSIPAVKVLFQGQLVDEFEGALPEGQLREFLDRVALPAGPGGDLRAEAAALVIEGKLEEALAKLIEASKAKPEDQAIQLDAVDVMYTQEADRANALRARHALAAGAAGAADTAELEAKLAANPADHGVRLDLSRAYAAQGNFRAAMEAALDVVTRDRAFDEGAGRKALLTLFEALAGSDQYDDLIREFRRKMSAALN